MTEIIGHIGINVSDINFWKDLAKYLDFKLLEETKDHFDATDGRSYLCVSKVEKKYKEKGFHRKQIGLNHIAFKVKSPTEVDAFVIEFLFPRKIDQLYGGSKSYPEYVDGYYAVYFEDPDRIKIEVVFEP